MLEQAVSNTAYIAGEKISAADVYRGSHIGWGLQLGHFEKREAFMNYWSRLSQRPAHVRAAELDDSLIPHETHP